MKTFLIATASLFSILLFAAATAQRTTLVREFVPTTFAPIGEGDSCPGCAATGKQDPANNWNGGVWQVHADNVSVDAVLTKVNDGSCTLQYLNPDPEHLLYCLPATNCVWKPKVKVTDTLGRDFHSDRSPCDKSVAGAPPDPAGSTVINITDMPNFLGFCNGGPYQVNVNFYTGHDCSGGQVIAQVQFCGICAACQANPM